MDKIYEQAMLFDFYGELLTEHQRSIYEDVVYHDLSLGEIAQERGISRQGVHDLVRRCDRILQDYEDKLHLVERFSKAKKAVKEIERLTLLDGETGKAEVPSEAEVPSLGDSVAVGCAQKETAADDVEKLQGRLLTIRQLSRELLEEL